LAHLSQPVAAVLSPTGQITIAIESAAVVASALSGMITASQKRLDIVGTASLALVTALGGGTLRDLLLDRRPFFWASRWEYVPVIFAMTLLFVYSARFHRVARAWHERAVLIDAIGLAMFSLTGLAYGLQARLSPFVAVLIGVLTGTGGGVMRDILVNETPLIFRPGGRLYALAAFVGCWAALGAAWLGLALIPANVIGFIVIVALRMLSMRYGVSAPDPLWLRESKKG
jgi:uncharacterized membrane protein YeiH